MMLKSYLLLIFFVVFLISGCQENTGNVNENTVNPVIGDISYINKFKRKPTDYTDEQLRIQTHLAYVEQLLERKDVEHLPAYLRENRKKHIKLLQEYRLAGAFPKNYEYHNQRKPCFIDRDGNICAVGYLVEKTAGRQVAERLNSAYQYAELKDMNAPELVAWVQESGLTLEECAMIQPSYGGTQPQLGPSSTKSYISHEYGAASSILSGANMTYNILNIIQINNWKPAKTIPVLGLLTGTGQLMLGLTNLENNSPPNVDSSGKKNLSMLNIGLGTSSIILSSYNLILNKEKKTNWQLYNYPTGGKQLGLGVGYIKSF